jgi:hypothetical protein
MSDLPVAGDRIELLEMGRDLNSGKADPCPIPAGTTGTVRGVTELTWSDCHQISVEWDIERSLALVVPPDRFRIIERVMD